MMMKLPKCKAWKQSDPYSLGLLLHPRYSSRDSVGIRMILTELPHSSKLDLRNLVGPRRTPVKLSRLSDEEGS
jgi:hypothetical protein